MGADVTKRERIDSLDHLRVYAAFTVLIGHAIHFLNKSPYYSDDGILFYKQGSGPVVFMAVAAFIAMYTDGKKFGSPSAAWAFLTKRMLRITPLYWIFTTLWLFIAIAFPLVLAHRDVDFWHVVCSYLYLPYPRPSDGVPKPVLIAGWTLSFIAWFYVLFAVCLTMRRRVGLAIAAAVPVAMCVAGCFFPHTEGVAAYLTDRYVIAFALGMAAVPLYSYLKNRGVAISLPWSIVSVCGLFVLSWMHVEQRSIQADLLKAACAFCIILVAALTRKLSGGGIFATTWGVLAQSSYSIYLSQGFSLGGFVVLLRLTGIHGSMPFLVALVAANLFALGCGVLVYYVLEKPLASLVKWLQSPTTPPPQAAGLPANGLPANGLPANGLPANGLPANGLPASANSAPAPTAT
jgi:peptidoglycan/LPS O-acetylase OafA/YrhL